MTARVIITGRGTALPTDVLGNDDVAALADAGRLRAFVESNVWCRNRLAACRANGDATADAAALDRKVFAAFVGERVGIVERRVVDRASVLGRRPAREGASGTELGASAASIALARAGRTPAEVDAIVLGSSTPESLCPSGAILLQGRLKATSAFAFDVQAACSSFAFALASARGLLLSGQARCVVVVAAEYFSAMTDWTEPSTSYFAGDGAAAVVLELEPTPRPGGLELVDTLCRSSHSENIRTGVGGTRLLRAWEDPAAAARAQPGDDGYRYFFQNGPQVYRDVLPTVDTASRDLLGRHGLEPGDVVRWWVHQASLPMIDGIFQRILGKRPTPDLVPLVLDRLGNTSSCGAAYCLAEDRGLEPGQCGVLLAFGGGYTVGAALVRGT
jgi:beta-ketodecanoyl-[acyl-carrier-protein] synthase